MSSSTKIISVAPMLDYTDRHYRYLARLFTPNSVLYTEMVTAAAMKYGNASAHCRFHRNELPVVLQLGGADVAVLADCAKLAAEFGYSAVDLNVGCPSPRVQSGRFGACLMREANLVADSVEAMRTASGLPISVKTRLGVDDEDSYEFFVHFIDTVASAGCETFIIHARKAWLQGLSPKENRSVPPLDYERVYRLKREFPQLTIHINGGITTKEEVLPHLGLVDGVMIGRAAYHNPTLLIELERELFAHHSQSVPQILKQYCEYMQEEIQRGTPMSVMARHLIPLVYGKTGARAWRHCISVRGRAMKNSEQIYQALSEILLAHQIL